MTEGRKPKNFAVIGAGPTTLYFLFHLHRHLSEFPFAVRSVRVFDRQGELGPGMPYSRETTLSVNLSNISSEEMAELPQTLCEWLLSQSSETLSALGVDPENIAPDALYTRLCLGEYFKSQFQQVTGLLKACGVDIYVHPGTEIVDITDLPDEERVEVETASGETFAVNTVMIHTGHEWGNADRPEQGFYASPWPIQKLFPRPDSQYNVPVGILGASLSAVDVVSVLAHQHGDFVESGDRWKYQLRPDVKGFQIILHSSRGWLPHLEFKLEEPLRSVYRHVDRETLLSLRDTAGRLSMERFFDAVCRPALKNALVKDRLFDRVKKLEEDAYRFEDFIRDQTVSHKDHNPFVELEEELSRYESTDDNSHQDHWKETFDDLMYCFNYHAELFSAEDHIFYQHQIVPLLLNVIAALPVSSAKMLLALHDAEVLSLAEGRVTVEEKSSESNQTKISIQGPAGEYTETYGLFVDCRGQSPINRNDFPFPRLREDKKIAAPLVAFRDAEAVDALRSEVEPSLLHQTGESWYYELPGILVDASYRIVDENGKANPRIYSLSYPQTMGIRPYSYGLQACNMTVGIVVESWMGEGNTVSGNPVNVKAVSREYETLDRDH